VLFVGLEMISYYLSFVFLGSTKPWIAW